MDRVPAFRKIILADTSPWQGVAWSLAAVAVPTGLRWALDGGGTGLSFATYFPAIVLTALLLGWKYGAGTAALSGIVANRLFRPVPVLFYGSVRDALFVALYVLICASLICITEMLRQLFRQQEQAARRETMLNAELVHRVKNMLATVSSIATMSARHSLPEEFMDAFTGRITALGSATDILGSGYLMACELDQLVVSVIAPFRDETNFEVDGPPCEISRDSCIPLALALHELCTNAAKYGALSVPDGRISLRWEIRGEAERRALIFWRESNGPKVGPVERRGLGMALLQPQTGLAEVCLTFPQDGAACEIVLDLPAGRQG